MRVSGLKNNPFINRIGRVSFVVFLRRYLPLFVLILLFVLSNIFGLWNIRDIRFELKEESNLDILQLEESSRGFVGENIFLFKPIQLVEEIIGSNGYVKDVYVEKRIPSLLVVTVDEYTPLYMGYSLDRCVLFSSEGTHIKEVCEQCLDSCNQESLVTLSSTSFLESDGRLIYIKEIGDITEVLSTFGYEISEISIDDTVSRFISIEGHTFTFDLSYNLDTQLGRMYLVGERINSENMEFSSLDLRFERPVMRLK